MANIHKKYQKDDIIVHWEPHKCIHSRICFSGLPGVFDPRRKPWVDVEAGDRQAIIDQVNSCPSGALSIEILNQEKMSNSDQEIEVKLSDNGPIIIQGKVKIVDAAGNVEHREKVTALCRCGGSSNKPFCDGAHSKNGFKG